MIVAVPSAAGCLCAAAAMACRWSGGSGGMAVFEVLTLPELPGRLRSLLRGAFSRMAVVGLSTVRTLS